MVSVARWLLCVTCRSGAWLQSPGAETRELLLSSRQSAPLCPSSQWQSRLPVILTHRMSMSFGRNTMLNAICSSTRQELTMATFIAHASRDFRHPSLLHGDQLHGT